MACFDDTFSLKLAFFVINWRKNIQTEDEKGQTSCLRKRVLTSVLDDQDHTKKKRAKKANSAKNEVRKQRLEENGFQR